MASRFVSSMAAFARRSVDVVRAFEHGRAGPEQVQWARVGRWVFVCHGNVCRSPFGEYWARGHGVNAVSCGLEAIDGKPADPDACRFASGFGVDLSPHAGARFADFPLTPADLVICFEAVHLAACLPRVQASGAQLLLLGLALRPRLARIADPYGRGEAGFTRAYRDITAALVRLRALGDPP